MGDSFSVRSFRVAVAAFAVVLAGATVGYYALTDEGWVASLYRAVVTTTLTGIDSAPPGPGAKLFTIFVLFAGVGIFLYLAGALVEVVFSGVLAGTLAERRLRRTIERLSDHYVICGYGRVGRRVAAEMREAGVPFVVLDNSPAAIQAARETGDTFVHGSGTDDHDLREAGLERARGLVASVDSDADNLYVTLSGRAARPDLFIVARASTEEAAQKLRLAGANRTVQPYATAGREMATFALRPQVAAYIDVVSTAGGPEFRLEEIVVSADTGCVGQSIGELRVRELTGALIVAVRKPDGTFDVTPTAAAVFEEGDVVIAVGTGSELAALEELFAPRQAVAR